MRSDEALRERAHDSRTAAGHVWLSFGSLRLANAVPKIIAQSQQHLSQLGEVATPLFVFCHVWHVARSPQNPREISVRSIVFCLAVLQSFVASANARGSRRTKKCRHRDSKEKTKGARFQNDA